MTLRGRHWVLLWLVLFLAAAAAVIGRQTRAYRLATTLGELRTQRSALEAQAAELAKSIRAAQGRRVLGVRARALGLRSAVDTELTIFTVPADTADGPR
jgi:hypothetical protein